MTAIYRLHDAQGVLLYVGISDDPWARFAQHSRAQAWWPEVRGLTFAVLPDRESAVAAERDAIWNERPRHNRHLNHGGRLRVSSLRVLETKWEALIEACERNEENPTDVLRRAVDAYLEANARTNG